MAERAHEVLTWSGAVVTFERALVIACVSDVTYEQSECGIDTPFIRK